MKNTDIPASVGMNGITVCQYDRYTLDTLLLVQQCKVQQ